MGTWYVSFYKLSKILLLAVLIGLSFHLSFASRAFADDNPNPTIDSGDGDDTDFARTVIVRTQI